MVFWLQHASPRMSCKKHQLNCSVQTILSLQVELQALWLLQTHPKPLSSFCCTLDLSTGKNCKVRARIFFQLAQIQHDFNMIQQQPGRGTLGSWGAELVSLARCGVLKPARSVSFMASMSPMMCFVTDSSMCSTAAKR